MIVDGLKAEGKDAATAKVVYVGGDPIDGNAKQFHGIADKVMSEAGIKPAFETPGTWDVKKVQTYFEQAYTAMKGDIDAVWVANDFSAASVISVLDKNGKTVPVSGQDASPPGLQNILLGKQVATVYKPFQLEAQAAVDLSMKLLNGEKPPPRPRPPTAHLSSRRPRPSSTQRTCRLCSTTWNAKVSEVCTKTVAEACQKAGLQ